MNTPAGPLGHSTAEPLDCRVARRIGEILPALMKVIRQRVMQTGLPQGLTLPQVLVLRAIDAGGEVQPSELARHFLMSAASVTSVVDGLVQKGFVDRRHDDRDRRTVRLRLTEDGVRVNRAAEATMIAAIGELTADLPTDRQERLLLALDDLETLMTTFREGERLHGCAVRSTGYSESINE